MLVFKIEWASSTHETSSLSVVGGTLLKIIFGTRIEGVMVARNFLNEELFIVIIWVIKSENIKWLQLVV
jgi:hypothetical protein